MAGPQPQGQVADGRVGQATAISCQRRVAIMALPPRTPCPYRMSSPGMRAMNWCTQAAMVAASSAPHIRARLTSGYPEGGAAAAPRLLWRKFSRRVVRWQYQCSTVAALSGAVTSRLVKMNE